MILKTVTQKKYEKHDSTENDPYLVTDYYSDIEFINKILPLEHEDGKTENIRLHFKDGREICLILRTLKKNAWIDNYHNVFLMNDEGKTIERII